MVTVSLKCVVCDFSRMMSPYKLLPFLAIVVLTGCNKLNISYEWKILDFDFGSPEKREMAIQDKSFIPENNLPLGLEVYENRIFVTVPRWKFGVAASLAYIDRTKG